MLDSESRTYDGSGNVEVKPTVRHQISNIGDTVLEFIDASYGEDIFFDDRQARSSDDIGEIDLGVKTEPILKLRPAL